MLKFFDNLTTLQKSLITTILSIILFIASAGGSYSVFSGGKSPIVNNNQTSYIPSASDDQGEDPKEPKTESCPLNGSMHTKKAKELWDARRPLAVMVENHTEARPQSGLSSADIVYEAVAEGGITRFMGVFLCNIKDIQVGPVRSARTYFLDWVSEYDGLYAHVGGANTPGPANALGQIIKYDIKDLNQFSIGFPTFWRDYQRLGHSVATEHTMYSTTNKLWDVGKKRNWEAKDDSGVRWDDSFKQWKFKDDAKLIEATAGKINVEFWPGYTDFAVAWTYDAQCNCYKRDNGGQPHNDFNNKKQLTAKNIVVQFERESHANDGYEGNAHLLYGTIGQGKALIFQDGKAIEGKWSKTSRTARSKYVDEKGNEIQFNRGLIWIQTIPEGVEVKY
jgi:hypothetical protein